MDPNQTSLSFDDNRLVSLVFGQYDQNVARIERRLGVVTHLNGNHIIIKGPMDACERAKQVFELLYERVKTDQSITLGDVD